MKMDMNVFHDLGLEEVNSGVYDGEWARPSGKMIDVKSPIDGSDIARVSMATESDYERIISRAVEEFKKWRMIPAPKRGIIIKEIGDELRKEKKNLGKIVTMEVGKTASEGEGEIQEMIDVSDLALGLSRQLYGLTIASERPYHRMYEQWIPLGPVAVISSFNFPASVWSWNAFIAAVDGDVVIWKPSSKAALTAVAVMRVIESVLKRNNAPNIFFLMVSPGHDGGEWITNDKRIPLVSFTGSVAVGKKISENVAKRLGKTILELGGNNGAIVSDKSDINIALRGVVFGALATAGQRCTTTRRVIVQENIYDDFLERLKNAYSTIKVGDPRDKGVLVGPLIDEDAVKNYERAIETAIKQGGKLVFGGRRIKISGCENGHYVMPAIIEAKPDMAIVSEETFAPILYVMKYRNIEEAIEIHNSVPQGLSSSIFTNDLREEEAFLSAYGSDCGLANVNTSTAGAEIGGAFGGEKDTGGGRESGSDAWKYYMRRQTVTKNWGKTLPLAQDVVFDF
ncbi:L-piperidine-6-carboxylate dehydrogenase [Picrophilus oshimae]|uniref:NAD-dependent aldehyde dehydrogenase n=1 Tax=Picrophilus torridus (strain ATCC 700027 / DSM 9790 / JCM 10055 / NBRC 100828 / KAW 2/3) TaxID=1122961 RepID=Q6L2J2_PICTO|nr:aldehyde dehydrogenase family protein [Picrophilus oshimae]AAT42810.1 NAD-dependent aldehyde dehydrogenase [Picrophilus oshimae DSM 9789]